PQGADQLIWNIHARAVYIRHPELSHRSVTMTSHNPLLLVVASTLLAGAVGPSTAADSPVVPSAEDAATAKAILSELLAIDTTYEKGTVAAVEALRKRFLAAGFPEADLVVIANPDNPSQSNLIVRMKGHGKGKPLLYLCHLDVVAAKPEDW